MTILGFRPALWPTLITLPAIVLTFGLGMWQLQRLSWKENLISERTARMSLPVLQQLPEKLQEDAHLFRRARFSGTFLHEKEMYRPARSRETGILGLQVITPLRIDGGGQILVNRGWIPKVRRSPETRRESLVKGKVTLVGLIRKPARVGYFVPDNDPERNNWFRLDLKQMADHTHMNNVRPYYVDLVADGPGGWPKGSQTRVTARNSHLEYALTWFSMNLIGIIIYILWHRRHRPAGNRRNGANA